MTALAVAYLSTDEARGLTDEIKAHVSELLPLIKEAFERRADVALGYANWLDYCDTELRGLRLPVDRRTAVAELRETGMSTRAIAAALDVPKSTVADDIARLPESGQTPEKVTSLDGRERPATRPAPPMPNGQEVADRIVAGIDQHIAAQPAPVAEPERPKPPAWDPEERRQHEEEVLLVQDIRMAEQQSKTLVTDVRALVFTVLQGARRGARGLVTRDMIADLRKAIDLLEGEIDSEE